MSRVKLRGGPYDGMTVTAKPEGRTMGCWDNRGNHGAYCLHSGAWLPHLPAEMHPPQWVRPEHLPPVDCPLLILLPAGVARAYRETYARSRSDDLAYVLPDAGGVTVTGRYPWSYP